MSAVYLGRRFWSTAPGTKIDSLSGGESKLMVSRLAIKAIGNGKFQIKGVVHGANFHVCSIEGEAGPITMQADSKGLHYTEAVELGSKTLHCRFSIVKRKNELVLRDPDYVCSRYVFSCGARVGLDQISWALNSRKPIAQCK